MTEQQYRAVIRAANGRQMHGTLTNIESDPEETTATFTQDRIERPVPTTTVTPPDTPEANARARAEGQTITFEPSVHPPTREQIDAAVAAWVANRNGNQIDLSNVAALKDRLHALFPQPTPSGEYDPARDDYLALGDALRSLDAFPNEQGDQFAFVRGQDVFTLLAHRGLLGGAPSVEPPSIADMAPGTTFIWNTDRWDVARRWTVRRDDDRVYIVDGDGRDWPVRMVNSSMIRDVTPPPVTPEAPCG